MYRPTGIHGALTEHFLFSSDFLGLCILQNNDVEDDKDITHATQYK